VLTARNFSFCENKIGGASERCKNLPIPLFSNGKLCFLAFRSASSGPKHSVVEDQQTVSTELSDILPGFQRQIAQVGAGQKPSP
jgi:hypothetical protein